jgi:hypothetical protein
MDLLYNDSNEENNIRLNFFNSNFFLEENDENLKIGKYLFIFKKYYNIIYIKLLLKKIF